MQTLDSPAVKAVIPKSQLQMWELGVGTLGDIDPLNKVPFKRASSRVQKGYPLRGLPNDTT